MAQHNRQAGQSWGASYSLLLLFLANLLNIADRSLLGIVVDPVKADLQLSDTEMSLVSGTAFVVFNLVVGILIAGWVDRGNRKRILVAGVAVWSGATALTGLAEGFYSLAATRALVGIGEATAFPVALSMIADLFVPERRARAVGLFQSSVFAGVVIGSIAAGVLAAAYGWRNMFVICGVVGFALVVLMMATMREPQRGLHDRGDAAAQRPPRLDVAVLQLLRIPGFILLTLGTGIGSMLGAVLPVWAPTFLLRSHDVALANVGALIGPTVGLGGITGTIAAGMLASRLADRRGGELHGLLVPVFALPLAIPFYLVFCFAPSLAVTMVAATIMNFLLASGSSPCFAAAIALAPPSMRGVAATVLLAATGILGAALAPLIVGMLSDSLMPTLQAESLRYAMASMTLVPLISAAILWLTLRRGSAAVQRAG